jgi:membrane protein DedA with SNARE-associated domain
VDLAALHRQLADLVAAAGPWAPLLLFSAALVEYVFPPFPGDLVVVFGAWFAVHGDLSWPVTFVAVTAGAVAGAAIDHRIGVALGRRLNGAWARRLGLDVGKIERFEAGYRRWGAWLLLANRFLPGVRGFLFLAAGASGIPLRTVLLYGGISAAVWNVALLLAGATIAHNMDELALLLRRTTEAAWIAMGVAAVLGLAFWLWRRRAAPPRTP